MPPPSARQKFDELRPDVLGPRPAAAKSTLHILAIAKADPDVTARTLPDPHAQTTVPPATSNPTIAGERSSKTDSESTQIALCGCRRSPHLSA